MDISELKRKVQEELKIDVERLLESLAGIKRRNRPRASALSLKEEQYLCLSLLSFSKGEIAYFFCKHQLPNESDLRAWGELKRSMGNLNSEMSSRVHKYIKELMNLEGLVPPWRDVILFLRKNGYNIQGTNGEINSFSAIHGTPSKKMFMIVEHDGLTPEKLEEILRVNGFTGVKVSQRVE